MKTLTTKAFAPFWICFWMAIFGVLFFGGQALLQLEDAPRPVESKLQTIFHDNHAYVAWRTHSRSGFFLHAPNCPCQKQAGIETP